MGDVVPIAVKLPRLDVTVYPMIVLPPLLVGATKATLDEATPAEATTPVGEPAAVTVIHGTPGQFSNAAFFQRTFNSSKLNKVLRSTLVPLSISLLCITCPFRLIDR